MEIVDIQDRNSEIFDYIDANEKKAYESNPFMVFYIYF